ncbi:MAG: efflux RND transporter permease subunit [Halorhodospira sp.]
MSDSRPESGRVEAHRNGPIAWMVANPVAVNLVMLLLLLGGAWSGISMQKEVFPPAQLDTVEVRVSYPGATPAEVEQGILLPVEEAVRGVQGIREISSTAREGSGRVSLELVAGADRMRVYQDIDQAVGTIRTFPEEAERPEVQLQSRRVDVLEIGLYGPVDPWSLRQLGERVRDRLLSDPDITQVELSNVPDYVTHVEIPQSRLRAYGLSLSEVARTLERSARDLPAGSIDTSAGEIMLRLKERKEWAEELSQVPVVTSEGGSSVTLGEIASVEDGFEEAGFHSQFNGQPSIELELFRSGEQSPLAIEAAAQAILSDLETELPPGVVTRVDSNRAQDFGDRLGLLLENGAMAMVIVLLILALFLEYRLAFWIMMGMTLSFVASLLVLPWLGVSLNMISLFGFLVALGIVVDDAIVVGENIYEHRQRGGDRLSAAVRGARDIAAPVTFAVLTNIIAFLPLLFVPGQFGNFWWPLPVVVITVLAISLLEALLILPAHLGHSRGGGTTRAGNRLHRWQRRFAAGFEGAVDRFYRPALRVCIANRYLTLAGAATLLLVVGSYAYSDHMGMVMMPEVAADEIEAGVSLPSGTTQRQAERVAERITEATRRMYEANELDQEAEGIKSNVRGQSFIDVEIVMRPLAEREMSAQEVIELWRDSIGDIEGVDRITFEAERGPGSWRDDISVDLSHEDIDVLEEASEALLERAETFSATRDVDDSYQEGKEQLDITLREQGRALGLTPEEVGRQVRDAFYGAVAFRHMRGTNEVEVRVKRPMAERRGLEHLEGLVLQGPDGTEFPLSEVARIERGHAFTSIDRRDGRRVITVGMDVETKEQTGQVLDGLRQEVLPDLRADYPGLTWTFRGSQTRMHESGEVLLGGFVLALMAIYGLLAVAFSSYSQPLIILATIPFGFVGAVIGHILLGFDLSLISLMGAVALSGVMVNDALIMVTYANRHRPGLSAWAAIEVAGIRRFRPILLTTLTTFGGLTPIILETSRQATYLIPMAISLGFGIVFATALIVFIVPCLYLVLEDLRPRSVDPADGAAPGTGAG